MNLIYLIGELGVRTQELADYLEEDFRVQIVADRAEDVKEFFLMKVPDLIIYDQTDTERKDILEAIRDVIGVDQIPVLCIADAKGMYLLDEFYNEITSLEYATGEVNRQGLINMSKRMMGIEVEEDVQEAILDEEQFKEPAQILIVDDSKFTLRRLERMLKDEYKVISMTDGEKAYEKLIINLHPDLILLDYDMPGWDGKTTFDKIKSNPACSDIPVVFLTAVREKEIVLDILKSEPAGYLVKPPEPEELFAKIEEVLNKGQE